jgi:endo-1,4-beta-xylanase
LIKTIQAAGAKIDGVGLQGHFIVGSTPSASALTSQLNTYVALGLEVAYTEVDVRFSSLPSTAAGLAQQATDYGSVVSACLAVSKCVGITVWDFDDKYSCKHNGFFLFTVPGLLCAETFRNASLLAMQ